MEEYFKTKQVMLQANVSKSTLKNFLRNTLKKLGLSWDSTPESISEKTTDIRKVVTGKDKEGNDVFHWEFSGEVVEELKKEPKPSEPVVEKVKRVEKPTKPKESSGVITISEKYYEILVQEYEDKKALREEMKNIVNSFKEIVNYLTTRVRQLEAPNSKEYE